MWSSELSRRGILAGLTGLAACGFTPVYAPGGAAAGLIGAVEIDAADNGNEFDLETRLLERLGPADAPRWKLGYSLTLDRDAFSASGATRSQISGRAAYRLTPLDGGGTAISGEVRAFTARTEMLTSPTDTAAQLSNDAARSDASRRLMFLLADRMVEAITAQLAGVGR